MGLRHGDEGYAMAPTQYQKAIVTFMDILGFAGLVDSGTPPGKLNEILDKVEEEVREDQAVDPMMLPKNWARG
jgi:hypothetical protein